MSRRKVPNVMRTKSKLTPYNLKNDKMSEVKAHYGWSEHRLEQEVRSHASDGTSTEVKALYNTAYGKKE